jgi:hypothetical protein
LRLRFLAVFIFMAGSSAHADPAPFSCTIQPDHKSVKVTIKNPFDTETQCLVNCQFSTERAHTSFQLTCGNVVSGGAERELCTKIDEQGTLVAMTGGDGDCVKPLPPEQESEDKSGDDDEADIRKLMKEGQDFIDKAREK